MPRIQISLLKWMMAVVLLVSLPVAAAQIDLLLLLPGFPGTSAQAQPYVDKMLRYLEADLGFEPDSMQGLFVPDGDEAASKLEQVKPGIALVGPSVYAQHATRMKMKVIAKVTANGRGEAKYFVVVNQSFTGDISQLSGTVAGAVVHDEKYVLNVLLDRQVAAGRLTLKLNNRPLRVLRDVAAGKVDAAIIDEETKEHMTGLPEASNLKVLYITQAVPAPAVVVLNEGKKHAAAIKKSISNLCQRKEGAELCKSLTISSISPATDADYKALLKRYNR